MNKEEIKKEAIKSFREMFVREDGLLDIGKYDESLVISFIAVSIEKAYEEGQKPNIENNTLTVKIPKGYKTLDTREKSEGDRHWIEVDLMKEEDMCKIRQPHTGFDCKCNKDLQQAKSTAEIAQEQLAPQKVLKS